MFPCKDIYFAFQILICVKYFSDSPSDILVNSLLHLIPHHPSIN